MKTINLSVNNQPLIFTTQSVTYADVEYFYSKISEIKHRGGNAPAYIFMYEGERIELPYNPKDKDITMRIFRHVAAMEKRAEEQPVEPKRSSEELASPAEITLSEPEETKTPKENRKPFYKKWYLYVIAFLAFLLVGFIALGVSGSGTDTSPLTAKEMQKMYKNGDFNSYLKRTFKDVPVEIYGSTSIDGIGDAFYGSIENINTTLGIINFRLNDDVEFSPKDGQHVIISGAISDVIIYDESDLFDELPFISVDSISENPDYTLSPAETTVAPICSAEKEGFKVTLEKIEQAKDVTRVYFILKNSSKDELWINVQSPEIKQGDQIYMQAEDEHDLDTLETEVSANGINSGFLSFERIEDINAPFTISFFISNDKLEGGEFVTFNFSISNGKGKGIAKLANKKDSSTSNENVKVATMGKLNALQKALDYLDYAAFSKKGLIEQLEYEGFTNSEARYGAKNCGADWKEQAAKKAQEYIDYTSFSRSGLIEQLEYEGFTHEQAIYGVETVGY